MYCTPLLPGPSTITGSTPMHWIAIRTDSSDLPPESGLEPRPGPGPGPGPGPVTASPPARPPSITISSPTTRKLPRANPS
ncbi:hypothetical protein BO82DRAFT_359012 [Aspergillus uvarum CBS 121591]|uniref:Uncharacterized protein n=1 Tax=Aspergillus uvarum CBS 121591 TaxID=1448315 RepID=A0A319CM86_9EURO|nr:hypothetical protein BO82DRAFT_359012 [Aspergillus uvarum CBS 121591]PYH76588.1 hypothetical protein BO82DRAFT_359012 [Aspergillus uvarum CBS 121591]